MTAKRDRKTVTYAAEGWPLRRGRPQDGSKPCRSVVDRIVRGDRSSCPTPTVWRVTVTRRGIADSRYWCDTHLPDEDRLAASNSVTKEGDLR